MIFELKLFKSNFIFKLDWEKVGEVYHSPSRLKKMEVCIKMEAEAAVLQIELFL